MQKKKWKNFTDNINNNNNKSTENKIGFSLFSLEKKKEFEKEGKKTNATLLNKLWKNLDNEEKKKFEENEKNSNEITKEKNNKNDKEITKENSEISLVKKSTYTKLNLI